MESNAINNRSKVAALAGALLVIVGPFSFWLSDITMCLFGVATDCNQTLVDQLVWLVTEYYLNGTAYFVVAVFAVYPLRLLLGLNVYKQLLGVGGICFLSTIIVFLVARTTWGASIELLPKFFFSGLICTGALFLLIRRYT